MGAVSFRFPGLVGICRAWWNHRGLSENRVATDKGNPSPRGPESAASYANEDVGIQTISEKIVELKAWQRPDEQCFLTLA